MNSKVKASAKNTVSAFIMQAVIMVIGIIMPRLYLNAYGSEINGLVTSITQFISYFAIVEAGLSSAGISALFAPVANHDQGKINKILASVRKFYFQVGYIFGGLVIGLAFVYPLFITVDGFSYLDMAILVVVLGLHGVIDFFTLSKYRALLTADQKYYVIANATTVAYIMNFAVVYIAIQMSLSVIVVRALALTMYIVRTLIINIYVRVKYKYLDPQSEFDDVALNKRWDAMILQLLGLVYTSLPVVLLTIFSEDLSVISVYTIYNLVAYSILTVLNIALNGVAGTIGNIIASKDEAQLQKFFRAYETVFLSVNAIAHACMFALYIPFIYLYTQGINDCEYIYPVTAVLFTLNGFFYSINTPVGTLIGTAGVYKETKRITITQTIIAVVSCTVLTIFMGINGLLIGLIASNLYRDVDLVIFMAKHVTHIAIPDAFRRIFISVLSFAISIVPFFFIEIKSSGYIEWIFQAIIVLLWATLVTLMVNLLCNFKATIAIIKKIINKIKRR